MAARRKGDVEEEQRKEKQLRKERGRKGARLIVGLVSCSVRKIRKKRKYIIDSECSFF